MSLSKIQLAFSVLVVAGLTTAYVLKQQAQVGLREENDALRRQVAELQTENGALSNRLAAAADFKRHATGQLTELLKLRGAVGLLEQQVGEMAKLREEIQRLQATQRDSQALQASMDALNQQQQAAVLSLNRARQGVLAFILFAAENQQQFPATFAQAAPFFKEGLEPIEMNFEIVYVGSMTNITNAAGTVVLREKHAWQTRDGKWQKTYGFADGHAEIHTEPDGNFDDWESQHIIPPPPNQ